MTTRKKRKLENKNLLAYADIQKWINGNTSQGVTNQRLLAIRYFCAFTGKNPNELIDEYVADESKEGRDKQNITKQQITNFKPYLMDELSISNNSAITIMGHVLGFYSTVTEKRVFFTRDEKKIFKRTKGKKPKPLITVEDIKKVLDSTKKLRDRAIILGLASSGMPIGDLLTLQWRDIKQDMTNPNETHTIKVDTNRIKNQTRYVTFFSPETKTALEAYFNMERGYPEYDEDYIFVQMRNTQNESIDESYILRSIIEVTNKVSKKKITPYTFRRFFRTQMRLAKMDKFYIDILTAHKVEDSDKAYDLVSEPEGHEELRKIYCEKLFAITILNGNNVKSNVAVLESKVEWQNAKYDKLVEVSGKTWSIILDSFADERPINKQEIQTLKLEWDELMNPKEKFKILK